MAVGAAVDAIAFAGAAAGAGSAGDIIPDDPPGVLVGGQALQFWADRYRVTAEGGTRDIDFLGTRADARSIRDA